jgi:hypothetical protein
MKRTATALTASMREVLQHRGSRTGKLAFGIANATRASLAK